ncbi:MAG: PAS domain S-box protein [Anaerolineae bacterium]|jgi:PAS domain S-box-containing protein
MGDVTATGELRRLQARVTELEERLAACQETMARRKAKAQAQLEREVEERRLYLERVLACTPDAIVTLDAEGRIQEWNPGAEEIFGFSREEAIGRELDPLITVGDGEMHAEAARLTTRTMLGQDVRATETVRYAQDGRPIEVSVAGSPIIIDGRVVGTVAVYSDIGARKRAEEALQESEKHHRTLVENLPVGVYRTTPGAEGTFLMANPTFLQMFGLGSEEALRALRVSDVYMDPSQRKAFSDAVVSMGSVTGVELHLKRVDGTPLWGSITAKAVWDPEGREVVWLDCTIEDITERKRATDVQALLYRIASAAQMSRVEHELFSAIRQELGQALDTRNFFIALYDKASDSLSLPYFVDEKDSFRTFPAAKTLTAHVIHKRQPLLLRRAEIESMVEAGEVELVGSLSEVWLGVPLEVGGEVIGALVVQNYDDEEAFGREEQEILEFVSSQIGLSIERVRAEEELRRLKEFNEGIVQNMVEGIAVQDVDGCYSFLNPAAAALLGYDPEELIGEHWTKVIPADQQEIVREADARRVQGVSDRYEVELLHRDGTRFPVLVSGGPRFELDTERFEGTFAVFTDISERVQAEAALARHAQEMAALYETSLEINSQRDLSRLLTAIVERAAGLLNVKMGGLYLMRPGGEELELVVEHNLPHDYVGATLRLGEGLSGKVALSGEPLVVDDYRHWDGRAHIYEGEPFRRVLGVPMRVGERVIGVINITDDRETGAFAEQEIRLASLFADQAAIAVENARLFELEARRRREAETLRQATQALSATLNREEVLGLILSELRQVVPYDSASVQQLRGNCLEIIDGGGFPDLDRVRGMSIDLSAGDNPNQQVVRERRPLILADAPLHYASFRREPHGGAGTRSWLGVPLLFGDQLIGMLALDKREPDFYDEEHAQLALAFAAQAAIAIENARLFEAQREQRELAEALRQATVAVSSTLDLDQILDLILEQVDRVIPGDAANVSLIDGEYAQIVRWRGYDRFGGDVRSLRLPLAETYSYRRMQETGQPMVVPDTAGLRGWVRLPQVKWIRSYAAAPIRMHDQIIGFLNVDSATPGYFDQSHADRLRAFAGQASLALANAELFRIVEQSKRDWEGTFDAMQDPVILVDGEHRIVRANRAFGNLLGQSLPEIVGQKFDFLLNSTICGRPPCPLGRAPENGGLRTCLHEYRGRFFEIQATHLSGGEIRLAGLVMRAIYAMRDISDRKQAEEEIHHRNQELAFLNRIIAAVAMRQPVEVILETVCRELTMAFDASRTVAVLLNEDKTGTVAAAEYVAAEESVGVPVTDFTLLERLEELGAPLSGDGMEGSEEPASWLIVPLMVGGEVVGSLEVNAGRDRVFAPEEISLAQRVADQVSTALARARLEEMQRRLSAAVEQSAEAIIVTDLDSTVLYANPAFEQITGYSQTTIIGNNPRELGQAYHDVAAHQAMWRTVRGGETWQGRMINRRPDGTSYVVDMHVSPVRNQAGETINYVATMRDITREVQLEKQFHQSQKMEALGRLAGGIAHDFNNLLTVIHLSTRLLERQLRPEDPVWENVQQIRETGERAAKLTRQLLSFSRREVVAPVLLDLNRVVGDLSRMLKRIIGEDIELVITLEEGLWSVKVDAAQMEQVIMNLVVNARDAMHAGGKLEIETANVTLDEAYAALHVDAQPGDHVLLTVRDSGEGMDDEVKSHLFEPFFTTKQKGQGTGLGLSTVFGIVTGSGGHIRIDSQLGVGTTVRVYLPRGGTGLDRTEGEPIRLKAATPIEEKKTVLVVEDDVNVRMLAVRVLDSYGYHVLEAENGREGLRLCEEYGGPIDVLITDVIMPQMSGHELVEKLQLDRPSMAVLYMSGYADDALPAAGGRTVDRVFLAKPFTAESLIHKVQAALQARQRRMKQEAGA